MIISKDCTKMSAVIVEPGLVTLVKVSCSYINFKHTCWDCGKETVARKKYMARKCMKKKNRM